MSTNTLLFLHVTDHRQRLNDQTKLCTTKKKIEANLRIKRAKTSL